MVAVSQHVFTLHSHDVFLNLCELLGWRYSCNITINFRYDMMISVGCSVRMLHSFCSSSYRDFSFCSRSMHWSVNSFSWSPSRFSCSSKDKLPLVSAREFRSRSKQNFSETWLGPLSVNYVDTTSEFWRSTAAVYRMWSSSSVTQHDLVAWVIQRQPILVEYHVRWFHAKF